MPCRREFVDSDVGPDRSPHPNRLPDRPKGPLTMDNIGIDEDTTPTLDTANRCQQFKVAVRDLVINPLE